MVAGGGEGRRDGRGAIVDYSAAVIFRVLCHALAAVTLAAAAAGQDPAIDLPFRRAGSPAPAAECLERGLDRLAAGWNWEAARAFRGLLAGPADDAPPLRSLGRLGLALAFRAVPNRAARLCWQAV
ncbi:MAG: hypothetical protein KDE27_03780, partial [Planctomycetes bacterium]|nr:hypothetical protein [Planctomycetota bacterium]